MKQEKEWILKFVEEGRLMVQEVLMFIEKFDYEYKEKEEQIIVLLIEVQEFVEDFESGIKGS